MSDARAQSNAPDVIEELFDLLPRNAAEGTTVDAAAADTGDLAEMLGLLPLKPMPATPMPAVSRTAGAAAPALDRVNELGAIINTAETQIAQIRAQMQAMRRRRASWAALMTRAVLFGVPIAAALAFWFFWLPPRPAAQLAPADQAPADQAPPRAAAASTTADAAPAPTGTTYAPAATPELFTGQLVTREALPLSEPAPPLPEAARQRGETGPVELDVTIDERGRVVQAQAVTGAVSLRAAAEAAARQWRYKPALWDSVPVSSQRRVHLTFR